MARSRISVNVDEEIKQNAQRVLGEIGIDMTTAINSFLRTLVREERIPFDLRTERAYRESTHREYIKAELEKSMLEAADTNTQWVSQNEMIAQLTKQREARRHV